MRFVLVLLTLFAQRGLAQVKNCYPNRNLMAFMAFVPQERVGTDQRDRIFQTLNDIYAQEVAAEGGHLNIFETANMEFGAWASRNANVYNVDMWQGVRYHNLINADAYALILCHEMGHHMGTHPKKIMSPWASVEGQSDYFANLKCFRRYLERQDLSAPQPVDLLSRCGQSFTQPHDIKICARSLAAGRVLGAVLADLDGLSMQAFPTLDKTDGSVVPLTFEDHPRPQCRLDTFRAGALCPVAWAVYMSPTDIFRGSCGPRVEPLHQRPRCWFAN